MHYCVDVNNEYQNIKKKFFRLSLLFSLILTVVIVADVLLVSLSQEDYIPCYIISIVISVLFAYFAIFFFTNIYNEVNARYRYFKGYESGLKPTDEVLFIKQSEELCYVNGLYVYPLFVSFVSNLEKTDKIIYTLSKKLNFETGDKLTITTYQRILIEAEKHK